MTSKEFLVKGEGGLIGVRMIWTLVCNIMWQLYHKDP